MSSFAARTIPRRGVAWPIGLVAWLLVIAWCTLRSAPSAVVDIARLQWYCVVCGDSGIADIILNILLFLPLGLLLRGLGWPARRTVVTVLAIAVAIETIQGTLLIGRDACIGDVLSDTAGSAIGWWALPVLRAIARPTAQLARVGSAALLAMMAALWLATGAGLQPSLTDDAPWIGQPMRDGRGKQPFPGTLQRATADGIPIPDDRMDRTVPWRDSIAFEIDATRSNSELFPAAILMLRIVDTAHAVEVAIDQVGDDARLRLRLRASDWLLHNPRWQLSHAMRMTPETAWRFRWVWLGDRFTFSNAPIGTPAGPPVEVPLSIGLGWTFIHPFVNVVGSNRLLWTTLWLAWWFGLLGWLAGHLGIRQASLIGAAGIAIFIAASLWWRFALQGSEIGAAMLAYAVPALVGYRQQQ